MLLLTATSTPLSTTDARYVYRCIEAASKHASKLHSLFTEAPRLTKTFLSRCLGLAQSTHVKLARCSPVLGTRNMEFNEVLSEATLLASSLASKLTFPARFGPLQAPGSPGLLATLQERVQGLRHALQSFLKNVGRLLAARRAPPAALAPKEKETKPTVLEEFFTKAERDKGWKIQRADAKKEPEEVFPTLDSDPFGLGCHIADKLALPYDSLLSDDVEVGLVSFSIILLEAYRLPETVLTECGLMAPLHRVFGSYIILQNAMLMGVHRDLMQVVKRGKNRVDEDRFRQFMPYLSKTYPDTADAVAQTFPSGPPRYARYHYYSPLLPRTLIDTPQFSLGNWSFLTSKRRRGPEHLSSV